MAVSQSLTLTQTGQSVANNTSKVRILWKSTQSGASYNANTRTAKYYVSINGGAEKEYSVSYTLPKGKTQTILDKTITVNHEADGDGKVKVRTWMDTDISAGVVEKSKTLTLDTIPRKSDLDVDNGTLGTAQTLTIVPAVSTFKHRLTYNCGNVAGYIAGSLTEYYTGANAISWTPPIGLAAERTDATWVPITLELYTYTADGSFVGSVAIGISCTIPTSVKPSCTISVKDPTGLMAKYGAAVQGLSTLEIAVKASTSQGAPISYYEISANGVKYDDDTATTDALTTAGPNKITATVKDTRGRTGSNSTTVDVLAYTDPVISKLTVHRCDADGKENDQGEFVRVVFSATVTSLNNKNTAVYTLRYKRPAETGDNDVILTDLANVYAVTDYQYIFAADSNSTYEVAIDVVDNHGDDTRETSVSTAFTLMNWHPSGTAMAIGKVSEKENALEIGLDIYDKDDDLIKGVKHIINLLLPVGSIVLRYDTTNPGTLYPGTTWTQITARVLRAGSTGSIGTEGSIADGSGRTYIDVAVWRRTA